MRRALALTSALVLAVCPVAVGSPAVGLTGGGARSLVLFDTADPSTFTGIPVTGIAPTELLDSVDMRPATGELLGIAVDSGGGTGHLYRIDWGTGQATAIGAPFAFIGASPTSTSMDVNPVVDRVRVINQAGTSLRVNPDTGALAGIDTSITPGATILGDVAYDRNTAGAAATTLYAINASTDVLSTVGGVNGTPSANTGVLATVGPLGASLADQGGFDIAPDGTAWMANGLRFGKVNLTTGAFSLNFQLGINLWGLTILQPSTLALDATSVSGGEATGALTVSVRRTGPATGTVRTGYQTGGGTATVGTDYTPVSGVLTFGPGVTTQTITIPVRTDAVADNETVGLTLSSPSVGASISTATIEAAIADQATATTPAPTDQTPPVGLVLAPSSLRRADILRGLSVQTACSEACSAVLTLRLGSAVIATATRTLAQGATVSTKLRLTAAGTRAITTRLRSRRTTRLVLVQRVTDAAGNAASVQRGLSVRR